jgi:hypothetical protein
MLVHEGAEVFPVQLIEEELAADGAGGAMEDGGFVGGFAAWMTHTMFSLFQMISSPWFG